MQLALYLAVLVLAAKPLGLFMTAVYEGRRTWLTPVLGGLERGIYRIAGVDASRESDWKRYALGVLVFNFIGFVVVYLLQRLQGVLPLNPQAFGAVSPDSSFNTAVSFATNTNWQGYVGEATMSYLTQMLGLAVQNFLSAATRHGRARGADPRLRAARGRRRSATSGSISRAARCTSCCRCRSCSRSC